MKQYMGLFLLLASSISGMGTAPVFAAQQSKPALIKSFTKQVKATINTPTGKKVKKVLPYLILGAYYIRCTSSNDLLPIPGFGWLKENLIGGSVKEGRFAATMDTKFQVKKDETTSEEKTVRQMFEEWKTANKNKKPGDYKKVFEKEYPDYTLLLEDYVIRTNTFSDKAIKQWKKTGVLSNIFKWTLIAYAAKELSKDTNQAWNYLTADEE